MGFLRHSRSLFPSIAGWNFPPFQGEITDFPVGYVGSIMIIRGIRGVMPFFNITCTYLPWKLATSNLRTSEDWKMHLFCLGMVLFTLYTYYMYYIVAFQGGLHTPKQHREVYLPHTPAAAWCLADEWSQVIPRRGTVCPMRWSWMFYQQSRFGLKFTNGQRTWEKTNDHHFGRRRWVYERYWTLIYK